jgi:hypothetical protein
MLIIGSLVSGDRIVFALNNSRDNLWAWSVVNAGVLQALAGLLLLPGSPGALKTVTGCLGLLCMGEHLGAVLQAGCVQGLVGLADSPGPEPAQEACLALVMACKNASAAQLEALVDLGVAEALSSSLARTHSCKTLTEVAYGLARLKRVTAGVQRERVEACAHMAAAEFLQKGGL